MKNIGVFLTTTILGIFICVKQKKTIKGRAVTPDVIEDNFGTIDSDSDSTFLIHLVGANRARDG
jgi:hypothetical protein